MKLLKIFSFAIFFYTMSFCQSDEWINYFGPTQVNSIAAEGVYLWIGTDINITRLNVSTGELEFFRNKELGMPEDPVASIVVDQQGNKWIGKKGGGLAKFDGNTWTILNYPALASPDHGLNSIAIDPLGNKWIATFAGLIKYNDSSWTQYTTANSGLPSNAVYSVTFDLAGNKWIGTSEGLVKFDNTNWTVYNTSNSGLPENYVRPVAIDHNGNIWMGNSTSGLAEFDGANWKIFNTSNSPLPANFINSIFIDAQGNKWFGTDSGLAKYDDHSWTIFKTFGSGRQINKVTSIAADQMGNKWIGTEIRLAKFDNSTWTENKYWNSGLPGNNVHLIAVDLNGKKWILAGEGVTAFDGKTWTTYNTSNSGLPTNFITTIAIDQSGNKWFGTQSGKIIKYDGGNWTTYNLPVQDLVEAIAFDTKGNTWVGLSGSGVLKFSNNSWTIYNRSNSGLPRDDILALAADMNGNIWVGTYHGSLVKFDGTTWTQFSSYFSTRVISVDRAGNVWIRADQNNPLLAKYDGSMWTSYTIPAGSSSVITSIQFDPAGNKWIGLALDGLIKFDDNNWTLYNTSNSNIVSNSIYTVAVDPADNKWIGSYYGLSVFREGGVILIPTPAAPKLISVANNSKAQPLDLALSWNESSGADTYQLQVAKDSLFNEIVLNDSALAKLSRDITGLLNATTYFWRVRAKNNAGLSPWSEVWKFTTIQALAGAPVLFSPKNSSADNPLTLTFSWKKNKNTDQYRLIVSEDDKFTQILHHDSTLTDTLSEVKNLKEGMKHYWKVSSKNSAGDGPFSEVWNFTTILYAPEGLEASVQAKKKIHLKWKDNSKNETGFVIERKQDQGFISIDTVKANTTNYKDSLASQVTTYQYRVKAYTPFASSAYSNTASVTLTGVGELAFIPGEFRLFQNYPNPFNPVSTIRYWLPERSFVELKIFDMLGREILTLISEERDPGEYKIQFNASGLPSGVYVYTIKAGGFRDSRKLILIK